MYVQIDPDAGFCFGVKRAIALAEDSLAKHGEIHSLGQIVHNEEEEDRLQGLGLKTITSYDPEIPVGKTILIRAHGEPPSTYLLAKKNQITLIDATCPTVKKLQEKVRDTYLETKKTNGQIVIIGKKKHPEVIGLAGQTNGEAIVVENEDDLIHVDPSRPLSVFAQTTADDQLFKKIVKRLSTGVLQKKYANSDALEELTEKGIHFVVNDTICRHVKKRKERIIHFAESYDSIVFVGGKNSSNGRVLFDLCRKVNPNTFFIENERGIKRAWFNKMQSVGITGATSTPPWLLKKVAAHIKALIKKEN